MIEDKDMVFAENPEEVLVKSALDSCEKRIREMKLSMELDNVVLEYLKNK